MPTEEIRRAEAVRGNAFARVMARGVSRKAIESGQWELARECIRFATDEDTQERERLLREVNQLARTADRARWATTREGA